MKVVFFDKQKMTFAEANRVSQIQRKHNGKCYEWLCSNEKGYTEHFKWSRFEVERIEDDA